MTEQTYKVLWIDDEAWFVKNYQNRAMEHHLDVTYFTNWADAHSELKQNFEEYSAIILDAYCKTGPDDNLAEHFLINAIGELNKLMGEKHMDIPWYILSMTTMANYGLIIEGVKDLRKGKEEWGSMEYLKTANVGDENHMDILFENILRVARQKGLNIALNRHAMMFSYMGKERLVRYEARKQMLRMLSALYSPKENINFQYEANPLRKVLEYLFRAARDKGLVPKECFEDGIHLNAASRYMAGLNPKKDMNDRKNSVISVRYGISGSGGNGSGGDAIFSPEIAQIVWNVLTYTNGGSHTEDEPKEEPYVISEESKELFFGYVLQLCHVILWFGKYVERHPNKDDNLKMQREFKGNSTPTIPARDDVLSKEYVVLNEGKFYYAAWCKLSPECKAQVKPQDTIKILEVEENQDSGSNVRYPYFATKIEKVKTT